MLRKLYGRWMYRWETALTTQDTNRIVRPVEWGFSWLADFAQALGYTVPAEDPAEHAAGQEAMLRFNDFILRHKEAFYSYQVPQDFVLEERHPQLFPTNVRPKTVQRDEKLRRQ